MGDARSIVPGAPVPSLARWGLSPDADLVYRTLVTYGPTAAAQLPVELGLSVRRVNNALAELSSADAVALDPGRTWLARPPDQVVEDLRRCRSREVVVQDQARAHQRTVGRLSPDRALPLGYGIQHHPTKQAARDRLAALVTVERHEHLAMNIEQAITSDAARAAIPIHRMLLSRGVRTRTISPPPLDGDLLCPDVLELGRLKVESRQSLDVPLKLFIIDRRVALFPVVPHNNDRGFLEISQPPIVEALLTQFERHWAEAFNPEGRHMSDIALTPREQKLISLLALGHTDATAAKELQIGLRSVTKILRGLMDRFEVENRFQLGLALGALRATHLPPLRSATHIQETS